MYVIIYPYKTLTLVQLIFISEKALSVKYAIGFVTLVAITGTTLLVPYFNQGTATHLKSRQQQMKFQCWF